MAGRFSVEAVFKAIDQITAPVRRMQQSVGAFTRDAERGMRKLDRSITKVWGGLRTAGRHAVVAGAMIGSVAHSVIGAGADFEQAITNVGAVGLQTRAQIAPLEAMALELGRTTKFTSTEAANAMEIMARAGFSVNDVLEATPSVLAAAAASGLEIAEVADHVSNALKGMGLETSQAALVADTLTLASARTNSSIGSLGESIRNVAATARDLNIPFKDVTAAVALLQDVGLDASVAGSAFNTMLTQMAAPTTSMAKKMEKFGVSFKDANGDMLSLPKVLEQINIAAEKSGGNFDRVAFFAELVGLRGQKAAANLGELFKKGRFTALANELENALGSAQKMADLRMNTVTGSWLLFGSAVDAVKVKAFGLTGGPLKQAIDRMTKWVELNGDAIATGIGEFILYLIENFDELAAKVSFVAKAIVAFIAFTAVLRTFISIMTLVNLVMLANPLGLIIAGVVALIAAFTALVVWIDDIKAGFDKLPAAIQFLLAPIGLLIDAIKFIKDNIGVIGDAISGLGSLLGLTDEDEAAAERAAKLQRTSVAGPMQRGVGAMERSLQVERSEITIKDETKRAAVSAGTLSPGVSLQPSGGF